MDVLHGSFDLRYGVWAHCVWIHTFVGNNGGDFFKGAVILLFSFLFADLQLSFRKNLNMKFL